jgi:hypothetical protein
MKRWSITVFGLGCLLLMAACAPSAEVDPGRVEVQQLTQALSFYPRETGAMWRYLPEGARLDAVPVNRRIEGPAILEGEPWIAWRYEAPGFIYTYYRQYRADGVYLRQRRSASDQVTFDPPLREYPAQSELRVGASWGGETTARVLFPNARPENRHAELDIVYTYTVVDRRPVTVAAGTFEVYVINFRSVSRDEQGNVADELDQTIWFAPHIGEVRTEQGYFLVDTNFPLAER